MLADRQTDKHTWSSQIHNTALSDGGGVIIDAFTFAYTCIYLPYTCGRCSFHYTSRKSRFYLTS